MSASRSWSGAGSFPSALEPLVSVPHFKCSLEVVHRRDRLWVHDQGQEVLAHKCLVLVHRLGDSSESLEAIVLGHGGEGELGRSDALDQAADQGPQLLADDLGSRAVETAAVVGGSLDLGRLQLSPSEEAVELGRAAGQVGPEVLQPRRGIFAVVSIRAVE